MHTPKVWKDRLRKVYDNSFEQFKIYDRTYGLVSRLGFDSPEAAWEANPLIQGSVNPTDYKIVSGRTHKAAKIHYVAMSGTHGCLPDHCEVYNSVVDAHRDLVQLFNLGRTRSRKLLGAFYLELKPKDGAEYCEISKCDCANPMQHSDSQ